MILLYLPNVYKNNEALSFLTCWLYQCEIFQYVIYFATVYKQTHLIITINPNSTNCLPIKKSIFHLSRQQTIEMIECRNYWYIINVNNYPTHMKNT